MKIATRILPVGAGLVFAASANALTLPFIPVTAVPTDNNYFDFDLEPEVRTIDFDNGSLDWVYQASGVTVSVSSKGGVVTQGPGEALWIGTKKGLGVVQPDLYYANCAGATASDYDCISSPAMQKNEFGEALKLRFSETVSIDKLFFVGMTPELDKGKTTMVATYKDAQGNSQSVKMKRDIYDITSTTSPQELQTAALEYYFAVHAFELDEPIVTDKLTIKAKVGSGFLAGIGFDEVAEVPVPAAAWLFGSAMLGLASLKRRNK